MSRWSRAAPKVRRDRYQLRYRHQEIDEARHQRVDQTANDRRYEAEDDAEREGQGGGHGGDEDGGGGAVDHAREEIATEIIGAEKMRARQRIPDVADDLDHRKGCDQRGEKGAEEEQRGEDEADAGADAEILKSNIAFPISDA